MDSRTPIGFVDLLPEHRAHRDEIEGAIKGVFARSCFVLGPELEAFEAEFAEYCGVKHAVGVGSGTDALHLTLRALGIGQGDEVITVSHTFVATPFAISLAGATPVFVDVREDDLLIDVEQVAAAVTSRTRAIVAVHLYGRCVRMDGLRQVASRFQLALVEDACQAHGAMQDGCRAGSLGDSGCFSFYPSKNLGAVGDGGAVVTQDHELAGQVAALRNYSQTERYRHSSLGFNSRLDELQAAVLRVKLRHLDGANSSRRSLAEAYARLLGHTELRLPPRGAGDVFHLFVIRTTERETLRQRLAKHGVSTQIHYPLPAHLQEPYRGLTAAPLPVTERAAEEVLSLPMYATLRSSDLERVCAAIDAVSAVQEGADREADAS